MIPEVDSMVWPVPTYAPLATHGVPTGWSPVPTIGMVATVPLIATTAVPTVAYVLSAEAHADWNRRMTEAARTMAGGAIRAAMATRVGTVSCIPTVTYMSVPTVQ